MVLVTGGTGLVGSHLLFQLLKEHLTIRATYRNKKTLERVKHVFSYFSNDPESLFNKIDWIKADINNIPQLQCAFQGITHVYHCAAYVSFEPTEYRLLRKINIEGTANIVNLCISHNIEKLCYVSSIATLGYHTNSEELINEQTEWNPENDNSIYAITKYGAELEVWRGTQEGLDAVIVNPGIILGAGYWDGGSSGNLFKRIHKGLKYYTTGTTGFVDIWDVIEVMRRLMTSAVKNEGFILVSESLSFKTFFTKVAQELNVKPPRKEAKPWLLEIVWRLDWLKRKLFSKHRQLTKQATKSLASATRYDSTKLKNALNFEFKRVDDAIAEVCELYLKDLGS